MNCRGLAQSDISVDPLVQNLFEPMCRNLTASQGRGLALKNAQIDKPQQTLFYTSPFLELKTKAPDGKIDFFDIVSTFVDTYEKGNPYERHLLGRAVNPGIPWIFKDPKKLKIVKEEIRIAKQNLVSQGLVSHTFSFNESLAKRLAELIVSRNGFGVQLPPIPQSQEDTRACARELSVDEVLSEKCADCSEFQLLYYEIARLAGLQPLFVEFDQDTQKCSFPQPHVGIALRLNRADPQKLTLVDLTKGAQDGFDIKYSAWHELPKRIVIATYYLSRALRPPEKMNDAQLRNYQFQELKKGLAYAPDYAPLQLQMGNYYLAQNEYDKALRRYELALFYRPHYEDAKRNIAVLNIRRAITERPQ